MKKILFYLVTLFFQLNNAYSQADIELDKLSTSTITPVAINTSLIADSDNDTDLGSTTFEWRNLYLGNSLFITRTTATPTEFILLNGNRFIHNTGGSPGGIINQSLFAGEGAGQNVKSTDDVNNGCVGIGYSSLNNLGNGYLVGQTTNLGVGNHNTAVGWRALINVNGSGTPDIAADKNTMVGSRAGEWISYGRENTGLGYNVFYNSRTSITLASIKGIGNVAIGGAVTVTEGAATPSFGLLGLVDDGSYNTIVGYGSGIRIFDGNNNTIIGDNAGVNLDDGLRNTIIGSAAAAILTDGDDNIFVGQNANHSADVSSFLNIGNTIYGDLATDEISIGSDLTPSMFNVGTNNQFQVDANGRVVRNNDQATAGNGIPSILVIDDLDGQNATLNRTLLAAAPEGMYRVSYMGLVTTVAATSSSLSFRVRYDDPEVTGDVLVPSANVEDVNSTSDNAIPAGVFSCSVIIYVAAGTDIRYRAIYASDPAGSMLYTIRVVLEKL